MHPRQASLVVEAEAVLARFEKHALASPPTSGPAILWKYEDPEGQTFYLEIKRTTIKSPFSGKSFATRPERYTPAQVGKEMKDERKEQAKNAHEVDLVEYVNRLAAGPVLLWQYTDPQGNDFWLDRKILTTIRSPFGGPAFTPKPIRISPSQIGKVLREEAALDAGPGLDDLDAPW
jgi:hypothetical protein